MKYYLPIHLNGGNRGCEGIAKGTAKILSSSTENLIGLCSNVPLDKQLNIDKYVKLIPQKPINTLQRGLNKLSRIIHLNYNFYNPYTDFISRMEENDIMLSTGGDMMCYGNNEVITTNEMAQSRGLKTVLWGCSMGEENLTPEKKDTLSKFSLIYARDSLTYNFFKNLGLNNIICYPDPAFFIEPEPIKLPVIFTDNNVIGINLSNYTVGADTLDTPFGNEVKKLFDYILNETSYNILLIPHVLWPGQDDRLIAHNVLTNYSEFKHRIQILNSENLNYLQIRHIISNCKMFIGGRTHAVISAYSTCVPSIALGYSIKSRGIAKDLNLESWLVCNTKTFKQDDLVNSFISLCKNYQNIHLTLKDSMSSNQTKLTELRHSLAQNNIIPHNISL